MISSEGIRITQNVAISDTWIRDELSYHWLGNMYEQGDINMIKLPLVELSLVAEYV